ncbi:MAG: hypothetical protein GYA15_07225 [Leptolinea sp.]|nr:hypothetical protein [Leptolinea sp.]
MDTSKNAQNKKVTLIADSIYNTIRISYLEKQVISTDVFNRLHNILQNSTAYLTYPSLKTSRFSHSLGCMHIAGMIFHQSIINAKDETRSNFFTDAKQLIEKSKNGIFAKEMINRFFDHENPKVDLDACERDFGKALEFDALYLFITPSSIESKEHLLYIQIYQAIRIAALLHDLGHPPYSHMVENALGSIYAYLSSEIQEKKVFDTYEKKRFYEIVDNIKRTDLLGKSSDIHETIGNILAVYVLSEVIKNISKNKHNNVDQLTYDVAIISQLALGILEERITDDTGHIIDDKNLLRSLHKIISSDLDADRMDYIERDLRSSSNRGHISYDRLLACFCLVSGQDIERKEDTTKRYYEFIPSIQALSSIEEFFKKRFELYQVVLFHHRVAKTDGLLTEAVIRLSLEFLSNTQIKHEDHFGTTDVQKCHSKDGEPQNYLTPEIDWLWKILDAKETSYNWKVANKFFQWDDAWLLNCLRLRYIQLKEGIISSKEEFNYQTNEDLAKADRFHVYPILEELLTNKKNYVSLYKRPSEFRNVDFSFLNAAFEDKDFTWDSIKSKIQITSPNVELSYLNIISYFEIYKDLRLGKVISNIYPYPRSIEDLQVSRGFFINTVFEFLKNTTIWTNDKKQKLFWKAYERIKTDRVNLGIEIDDIIPLFKVLKPGVTDEFHLSVDGIIEPLGKYSRIVQELILASYLFPPFYVAIFCGKKELSNTDLEKIQKILGKALWSAFVEVVKEDLAYF